MKKTKSELEAIKNFIERTYSRRGNIISVKIGEEGFNPSAPLGYCYLFESPTSKNIYYRVVCNPIGIEETDFRVMMHEYGHIYLGHLNGIHEELDSQVAKVILDHREELIDRINKECGIDFGEKLVERVIDDPRLNHSLHNIAMDMEVNSVVLSKEDVEEMEKDISSVMPKHQEELLKYLIDKTEDSEEKKKLEDRLKKLENETKIKLIIPERYEFPDGLTYSEYFLMIIKNLDKFIKMMVSIKLGGNGDTKGVSSDDVQKALGSGSGSGEGDGNGSNQQDSGESGSGGGTGYKSLDDLMKEMGMSDGESGGSGPKKDKSEAGKDSQYKGKRDSGSSDEEAMDKRDQDSEKDGYNQDHNSKEREEADKKRELGQIIAKGGIGCGKQGGPDIVREVDPMADEVEMALTEVLKKFNKKVISRTTKVDKLYLYNRGINRSVIAPVYRQKIDIVKKPTITFLIDVSGSMDTRLVDRCLKTISRGIKKINRGLRYNIITWSTELGEHIKNINPSKGVPRISHGGGTRMAKGIKYFKDNYSSESILVIISDFEDYLQEWAEIEGTMNGYLIYGFNYGSSNYNQKFKNLKVKNFSNYGY